MKTIQQLGKILMSLMFLGSIHTSLAQSLTPEVLTTAGETYTNSNIKLSWTLGEGMTESYTGATVILTQGFQQPALTATSIKTPQNQFGEIKVYPNPTSQSLFIERERGQRLDVQLMDMKGSLIMSESLHTLRGKLDVSSISRGVYLLKMTDGKNFTKTVRVEKM